MKSNKTQPVARADSVSIARVGVEVIDGDDAGVTTLADHAILTIGTAEGNNLVLTDPTVSRYHAELRRAGDIVTIIDHGSTNGTFVGAASVQQVQVPCGTSFRVGQTTLKIVDAGTAEIGLRESGSLGGMEGRGETMQHLFAQIERAARSDVAVLLVGESGTGKELVARALHDNSDRADGPFVVVDCASLTPTLVASELFGHERGAFTGAERQHIGAFEAARGGTVFLDEVGELPASLQPNLLGVLERRQFRRLGGRALVETDIRIVAASNRDLRAEVNAQKFRLDLYFRLAVVRLQIPPLRERLEDLPVLIAHFLTELGVDPETSPLLSPERLEALESHHWAGNIRELRNHVEAAVALGEIPALETTLGEPTVPGPHVALAPLFGVPWKDARAALIQEFERHYLGDALKRADGNVAQAARKAGIDRSYMFELLKRHGLR